MLRQLKADLVHTHVTSRIDLQAAAVICRAKLPWVWTIHGLYAPQGADLIRWRRAVHLARGGRGCISAVSSPVAEDIVGRGLVSRDEIRVVHSGADVGLFALERAREPGWRSRWGIPEDAVVFGSCGRLVTEKAYDVFIRAAHLLKRDGVEAHFAIAGAGKLQGELESDVARLGLGQQFHLIGYQADIPSYLKQLDVFVLCSRSEGFGLALIEALASGLPCVATRVGGMPEMLGNQGGVIVEPESPAALAEAMRRMLSPAMRESYARVGPEIARRFSFDECAARFSNIYDEIMA